jgi:tetratricopeptide (TPR) repeat protein
MAPIHATLSTAPERPHPHRLPPLDNGRTHPPPDASSLLDSFLCGPEPDDLVEQERVLAGLEARLFGNAASVTLSRYVLLRRLGAGSHGVVYEGYDPELDRKVAIKLVRTQGLREAYRQRARMRLLREAQAMAHVSHPNVITVHDLGTYDAVLPDDAPGDDGDPRGRTRGVFLVMELLEGGTLADWIQTGPHPWRDVLDVFIAAGRGLAAAHDIGLIHRDFKPANVLLGGGDRVCVSDFGLARASAGAAVAAENVTFSRDSVVSISLTHTGMALGTPAYMAPEQHAGIPCDARSDQYSFCVALYEALHGRRPFPQSDLDALRTAKRTSTPPPRSRRVPAWLHRLVLRGLHPDPDRRHPSMRVLVEALERGRARRRRRASVLTAIAVGLAALLAGTRTPASNTCDAGARDLDGVWDVPVQRQIRAAFAASTRPHAIPTWRTVSNTLDRYTADWRAARAASCEQEPHVPPAMAEQQRLCLTRRRERLAAITALLGQADDDIIEHALDLLPALPDIAPCRVARGGHLDGMLAPASGPLRDQIEAVDRDIARAEILWRAGKHAPARAIIDAAASRSRALVHGAMTAEALRVQALLARTDGDARAAETHLREAVRLTETAGAQAQAVEALIELVGVLGQEPAPAGAGIPPGAPALPPVLAPGPTGERATEAVHLADMAQARIDYLGLGEHQRARLALYRSLPDEQAAPARSAASLRAAIDRYGQAHPDPVLLGQMYLRLGTLLQAQGESQAAEAAWRRAFDVYRDAGGPDHPRLAEPLSRLGAAAAARANHEHAWTRTSP